MQQVLQKIKLSRVENTNWLLLLYQVPAQPSTHRSYVWRKLKAWGAVYLQNAVAVLPDRGTLRAQLEELSREMVEARGCEAKLWTVNFRDDNAQIIELFQAQSDEEYTEFLGQCVIFHAELSEERAEKHFTFPELDENDSELHKLKTWLPKIHERDFFAASRAQDARDALSKCESDFEQFGREVEAVCMDKES